MEVVILGGGNVAWHLYNWLRKGTSVKIKQLYARNLAQLDHAAADIPKTNNPNALVSADIYLLAVSDAAIEPLSQWAWQQPLGLWVHVSGITPMEVLPSKRKGVFYVPQSMTKGVSIVTSGTPCCLEANSNNDVTLLKTMATAMGFDAMEVNTHQRQMLHLAAMFANNFTNHMIYKANEILAKHQLPKTLIAPMIREVFEKIQKITPYDAQTGPARRGDMGTIEKHRLLLKNNELLGLYDAISQSIFNLYNQQTQQ